MPETFKYIKNGKASLRVLFNGEYYQMVPEESSLVLYENNSIGMLGKTPSKIETNDIEFIDVYEGNDENSIVFYFQDGNELSYHTEETIETLKSFRQHVQVMAGKKLIRETEIIKQ